MEKLTNSSTFRPEPKSRIWLKRERATRGRWRNPLAQSRTLPRGAGAETSTTIEGERASALFAPHDISTPAPQTVISSFSLSHFLARRGNSFQSRTSARDAIGRGARVRILSRRRRSSARVRSSVIFLDAQGTRNYCSTTHLCSSRSSSPVERPPPLSRKIRNLISHAAAGAR